MELEVDSVEGLRKCRGTTREQTEELRFGRPSIGLCQTEERNATDRGVLHHLEGKRGNSTCSQPRRCAWCTHRRGQELIVARARLLTLRPCWTSAPGTASSARTTRAQSS